MPSELAVTTADIGRAHDIVPPAGVEGGAVVRLSLDPPLQPGPDTFLSILPPASYGGSVRGFAAGICETLMGAEDAGDGDLDDDAKAVLEAIHRARAGLHEARQRFMDGRLPPGGHLLVRWSIWLGEGDGNSSGYASYRGTIRKSSLPTAWRIVCCR